MSNMDIWNKVARPPATALKPITGGRLKGKTDINPQWRFQAMTEVFGAAGVGWKYTIDKLWTEPGSDGQIMAFALINLYTAKEKDWNQPIPGIGGSTLIQKETGGLYSNDEAYKMAVTDALSVAMKSLGVAADIYAGLWDGSKYRETIKEGKGVHKPSDGAFESLDADMQTHVKDVADEVKLKVVKGDVKGAYEWLQAANLEADAKVACWNLIQPAHIRTALTNYANGLRSGATS